MPVLYEIFVTEQVAELFGLVRFLRHDPYAYYTCRAKGCNCKKLDWQFGSRGARCVDCGHSPMQHGAYFNQEVLNPITKCGYSGAGATAMIKLRRDVLNPIMLRRTKKGKAADLGLPPLNINVEEIELDAAERDFYECVYKRTQSNFSTLVFSLKLMDCGFDVIITCFYLIFLIFDVSMTVM